MSDFDDLDRADSAADSASAAPSNPRKRKKSSRACDFCHVNHQPCDNSKPRCSYCERHNKPCLYLRPQKKRGPAQGYRTALQSLRESAAAWGVALQLIPSLGPVVEDYLKGQEGKRLAQAIKDPAQQEFFIQAWQHSNVYKAFFGDVKDDPDPDSASTADKECPASKPEPDPLESAAPPSQPPPHLRPLVENASANFESSLGSVPTPSSSLDGGRSKAGAGGVAAPPRFRPRKESVSLSDIVAKDAQRSTQGFSQTLGSLGFASDETIDDFLAMTFDPEPVEQPAEHDPSLGSEMDQKAYYELLMGKTFS